MRLSSRLKSSSSQSSSSTLVIPDLPKPVPHTPLLQRVRMDRTQSRQVGQLPYSNIAAQTEARGVNGPFFSKVACGGGNANGPLFKQLSSSLSWSRPDPSVAYLRAAQPSSDEDITRLIPQRPVTPPPKEKLFKPKIPSVWPTGSTLCCTNKVGISNVSGQLLPHKNSASPAPTFSQAPRPCLDFTTPPPLSNKHTLKSGESYYVLPFPDPYRYPDDGKRKTPVPRRDEWKDPLQPNTTDFIQKNRLDNVMLGNGFIGNGGDSSLTRTGAGGVKRGKVEQQRLGSPTPSVAKDLGCSASSRFPGGLTHYENDMRRLLTAVFQGKVKSPAPATAPAGMSRFYATNASAEAAPRSPSAAATAAAAAAAMPSPSPFRPKKFQRGQVLPFNLHGKHRDRRPFKHPGEPEPEDDGGHAADFPAGVFLAQKDRKQVLDRMKQQWEEFNSEYQKLTLSLHNLHTIERVKRREQLESQIAMLERSIQNLEKPFVFLQAEAPRPATRAEGMLHAHQQQKQPRAQSRGA